MSRYIIESDQDSFLIRGGPHAVDVPGQPRWLIDLLYDELRLRREPVRVVQEPFRLRVEAISDKLYYNLFDYRTLLRSIAGALLLPWTGNYPSSFDPDEYAPNLRESPDACEPPTPANPLALVNSPTLADGAMSSLPGWLCSWATKRTEFAINRRVHGEWKRLLFQVDPTVLAVQRKVFAATCGLGIVSPLLCDEQVYREKWIVKDILAYRAAAVAAQFCDDLGGEGDGIAAMSNWRSLFAPRGTGTYTSLDKTLMKLPGGVSPRVLCDLQKIVLPRPIFDRLELTTTILAGSRSPRNYNVFAHARAEDIAEAMRRIGDHRHTALSHRRWRDVRDAVQLMLDFPEDHAGRIVGLAEKSIRWHRAGHRRHADLEVAALGRETAVAVPPIPLPEIEGLRFLATVGDIADEGVRLEHCIGSYARKAVQGECYLFHVDHLGDEASVEVNPFGAVVQTHGPHNTQNKATRWAERVLGQWGRAMFSR